MLQNWNNRTFERCCWMLVGSQVLPVLTSTQYGDFFLSVFLNIGTINILDSLFVGGVGGGAAWGTVTHPAEPLACTCDGSHLQPPQVSPAQLCSISFKWPSLREEVTFWGFHPLHLHALKMDGVLSGRSDLIWDSQLFSSHFTNKKVKD